MAEREDNLLRRAAQGDAVALGRLYELHVDALYSFIYFRVGCNPSVAEDAVHDTFLKALAEAASFDPSRGCLRVWLCETSRNVARRHMRGSARLEGLQTGDPGLADLLTHGLRSDGSPLPEEALMRKEVQALVARTVARLPEAYREVLELKYIAGLSLEELGGRAGTSVDAVKSQLARARRAFRDEFLTAVEAVAPEVRHGS